MTKDLAKIWAERMTKAERDTTFPDSEPRDAATLMLIDRSSAKPKVLLGRRHAVINSCPASLSSPAAASEELDRLMPAVSELHRTHRKTVRARSEAERRLRALLPSPPCKTAEETGLCWG
jgi:hypothetical protein